MIRLLQDYYEVSSRHCPSVQARNQRRKERRAEWTEDMATLELNPTPLNPEPLKP